MRFLAVVSLSLFVGLALGSPIGQVDEVTTNVPDLLRSDLVLADEATTVVVEVLSDEAVTSATQRARQDEESDEEGDEATTVSSSGSGASSTGRIRPNPQVPQPFANVSNFLAEYEFSSQFNLGPKDESVPVAEGVLTQVNPQVAQLNPPVIPPAVPGSEPASPPAGVPLSGDASPPAVNPTIVAAAEDEDGEDVESDEAPATEVPAARQQQPQQQVEQQQPEVNRIEESDSDNEITNDDITTVKSFISEYEYTVQQLGGSEKRVQS